MTRDELVEYQRNEKEFAATPIGAAFFKFENALAAAWREDAALEYQDNRSDRRAKEMWTRADAARAEFRALIERPTASAPANADGQLDELTSGELAGGTDSLPCPAANTAPAPEGWRTMESAPTGDDDFFLVCAVGDDRSPFVVRGSIFKSARKAGTPAHLSLGYLTHWHPLPPPPLNPGGETK